MRRHFFVLLVLALGCKGKKSDDNSPTQVSSTPPSSGAERQPKVVATDLELDSIHGWEKTNPLPVEPVRDLKLDPNSTLALGTNAPPVSDISFRGTEEALCATTVQSALRAAKPSRVLFKLETELTPRAAECFAALSVDRLYLALCKKLHQRVCDGDAQLQILLDTPGLGDRIRGLSIAFAEGTSVRKLARLPNLEYLAVSSRDWPKRRATKLDAPLPVCKLEKLRYLDVYKLAGKTAKLSSPCVGRLHTVRAAELNDAGDRCDLRRLTLTRATPAEVDFVGTCKQLERLRVDHGVIDKLERIAALTKLKNLSLSHSDVTDLSALARFTELEVLRLYSSVASDFSPIEKLPKLRELGLIGADKLTDAKSIGRIRTLEELDLAGTQIADLGPLENLVNLRKLDLAGAPVSDISPLARVSKLAELDLSKTNVRDLSPLSNHPSLETLELRMTPVTNLKPLARTPKLRNLDIRGVLVPADQVKMMEARLDRVSTNP